MSATPAPHTTPHGNARGLRSAAVGATIVLQLVLLFPFTVATGLLAPLWAIVVAYGLWAVAAATLVVVARRQPLAAPAVPVINGVVLWAFVSLGQAALGWTP